MTIMRFTILATVALFLSLLSTGCTLMEKAVYRPDINQGNYLTDRQINTLKKGMTKQQVIYVLGSPMLQDPYGDNSWIYIFRQQVGHEEATQKTIILKFDSSDLLDSIQHQDVSPVK